MEGNRRAWASYLGTVAFALVAGGTTILYYQAESHLLSEARKIDSLNTALRTTTQKLYDLQEGRDDAKDAMEAGYQVQLYNKDQEIDACKQVLNKLQPSPPSHTKKVGAFHE